jgi:hypothetical protein
MEYEAAPQARHVAYGFRDARLVHVSDVPRGLACGCVCAGCGRALVARKGARKAHHFAHHGASACDGGIETVLHRLGKELLTELQWIALPEFRFQAPLSSSDGVIRRFDRPVFPARRVRITRVLLETPVAGVVPDVVLESGSRKLLVEICVTHAVDRAKLRKVRRANLSMLEIRLAREDAMLPRAVLQARLQGEHAGKLWLYSPHQRAAEAEWLRLRRDLARARRRVARTDPRDETAGQGVDDRGRWIRTEAEFVEWARRVVQRG